MENNHSELFPNTTILLINIMWKIILFLTTNPYGQLLTATATQIVFITTLITKSTTTPENIIGSIIILMSLFITIRNPIRIKRERNNKIQEQKELQQHQHAIDIQHQVEILHRTANYHHNKKNYNIKTQGETIMEINELTNRDLLTEYEDALNDCSEYEEKDLYKELLKRMEYSKYSIT